MTDQGKEQQVNIEPDVAVTRNFLEAHKVPLAQGLIDILRSSKIILIGDAHTPAGERLRTDIASTLPQLSAEGGITSVAVELDSIHQQRVDDLEADNPDLESAISDIAPAGWYPGNIAFLVAAKRLGLKIICIDLTNRQKNSLSKNNTMWQNMRNSHMFQSLEKTITEDDKILVLVGADHIHRQIVERGVGLESIRPLGMRLTEKYGDSLIRSVRPAYREGGGHFDNLLPFMSKTPTIAEVINKDDPITIVPDQGPVKGDSRVSATDYVVIA